MKSGMPTGRKHAAFQIVKVRKKLFLDTVKSSLSTSQSKSSKFKETKARTRRTVVMGCGSSSPAETGAAAAPSSRAAKPKGAASPSSSTTPSTKSPGLSSFEMKLQRINANDPALRHFQGCWGDEITEKEGIQLLSALERNDTVKSIEFCSNTNLGIKFCEAMVKLLEKNHDFAVVSLRCNPNFGDEGVKLLCQGLEKNAKVLDFFIDGCGIGEAGAVAIGKMLSFNRKLFRLDVSNSNFTSAGVDFIAEGVIENGTWVR